jgi:TPR repeat protein
VALTSAQFERAANLEEQQLRLQRLQQMTYRELRGLLTGDPGEAASWVRSAAEYGVPAAQVRYGRMLLEGVGVERDVRAAFMWFDRAAEHGDAEAMNMVGRCYENGWGTSLDLPSAAACYRSAAESGYHWGEYNYGNMLFDGRGVERDAAQALQWYLRAARQGHSRAMNLAGRCLEEGWGCARSSSEAAHWYRRSAEAGYFRAQFNYAVLLAERGHDAAAAEWFRKAAASCDPGIRRAIGLVLAGASDPDLVALQEELASMLYECSAPPAGPVR